MPFRISNPLTRRNEGKRVEILPPEPSQRAVPKERVPADEIARRVASKAGSIVGGTLSGFASGVAKHTVAPAAQSLAQSAQRATRSVSKFVRFVFVGIFIVVLSAIGLLALIILSAPRR